MVKQFQILVDWYKVDKRGKQTIVKRNLAINREFDINNVLLAEFVNDNGNIIKRYSLLIDKDKGDQYKLNMPYKKAVEYIKSNDDTRLEIKGFAAHIKKKK
jgi:hypothetical protein